MAFASIRGNFDAVWANFPMRPNLPEEITTYIQALRDAGVHATECCLQLSWALNAGGSKVPQFSYRRINANMGRGGWGLGACDEVEFYLTAMYGPTEDLKINPNGGTRSVPALREVIAGRQGILVFRDNTPGQHVELWQGRNIKQRGGAPGGMSEGFVFGQPRILFWEFANTANADAFNIPEWLVGWWHVTDGDPYWYYFSPQGKVSYVETKPTNLKAPPARPGNTGTVTVSDARPQVTIEWAPTGGAVTVEKFTSWGNIRAMAGVSNRFAPLAATKL